MLVQYLDQEIFLPVEDLIDNYMPNLKKILDENPQYREAMMLRMDIFMGSLILKK